MPRVCTKTDLSSCFAATYFKIRSLRIIVVHGFNCPCPVKGFLASIQLCCHEDEGLTGVKFINLPFARFVVPIP